MIKKTITHELLENHNRDIGMFGGIFRGRFKIEGEDFPAWYYGRAYREFGMRGTVCYPIPLNFIVSLWKLFEQKIWWKLQGGILNSSLSDKNYIRGFTAGYGDACKKGLNQDEPR